MLYPRRTELNRAQRRRPAVTVLTAAAMGTWFYAVTATVHAFF